MLSSILISYYVRLDFISDFRKLHLQVTSYFEVIIQM